MFWGNAADNVCVLLQPVDGMEINVDFSGLAGKVRVQAWFDLRCDPGLAILGGLDNVVGVFPERHGFCSFG